MVWPSLDRYRPRTSPAPKGAGSPLRGGNMRIIVPAFILLAVFLTFYLTIWKYWLKAVGRFKEVGDVPKGVPLTETINEKFVEDKWGGHIQAENNTVLMEFLTKVERDQA